MNRMILANLANRPVRTVVSVFAVAIEVLLILLIVGLSLGMLNDGKTRQQGIGADVLVQPPGSSYLVGLTGAPVSVKLTDVLRGMPHVQTSWSRDVAAHDDQRGGTSLRDGLSEL